MTRLLGAACLALLLACASPPLQPAGRGALPKYEAKEQTYWTAVGVEGDTVKALVNEERMIEVGERSFSVEPFLRVDGRVEPIQRDAGGAHRDGPEPHGAGCGLQFVCARGSRPEHATR